MSSLHQKGDMAKSSCRALANTAAWTGRPPIFMDFLRLHSLLCFQGDHKAKSTPQVKLHLQWNHNHSEPEPYCNHGFFFVKKYLIFQAQASIQMRETRYYCLADWFSSFVTKLHRKISDFFFFFWSTSASLIQIILRGTYVHIKLTNFNSPSASKGLSKMPAGQTPCYLSKNAGNAKRNDLLFSCYFEPGPGTYFSV